MRSSPCSGRSSREHAPWALADFGFHAIIAPSYADIFCNNCYKNGLLPIVLPESQVDRLFADTLAFPGFKLTIDLDRQLVGTPDGALAFTFDVEPFRKHCLLNGLDEIGLTLTHADAIRAFETKRLADQPWIEHRKTSEGKRCQDKAAPLFAYFCMGK